MRTSLQVGALALLFSSSAAGQEVTLTYTERPGSGGSVMATVIGATGGAVAGLGLGILLAPKGGGDCPVVPHVSCGGASAETQLLVVAGSTLVGTTSGAYLGRRLTGGRQSLPSTVLGGALGMLGGAWLTTQFKIDQAAPAVVAFTIPTGLFAAIAGW